MIRFQVNLDVDTFRALRFLSNAEYRDFRNQASLLIREALENRGLLVNPKKSGGAGLVLDNPPSLSEAPQ